MFCGAGSALARATSSAASRRTPLESVTTAVIRLAASAASASASAASASVNAPQLIRRFSALTSTAESSMLSAYGAEPPLICHEISVRVPAVQRSRELVSHRV